MTRKEEIQEKSENEPGSIDYQVGFSQGAQWADETMIEKACEWLESNLCCYDENYRGIDSGNSLIEDFKKAMMEE